MPLSRLGSVIVLAACAWGACGTTFDPGLGPRLPGAAAQGTLTPPAGQTRVTAPGGLRGRGARRHRTHRFPAGPAHRGR